jgi:hypothetical protein
MYEARRAAVIAGCATFLGASARVGAGWGALEAAEGAADDSGLGEVTWVGAVTGAGATV